MVEIDPVLGREVKKVPEWVAGERDTAMMMRRSSPKQPASVASADRQFMIAYRKGDYTTARLHLRVLKDWLKGLKSLPPLFEETPRCLGELSRASSILVRAVLMTLHADEDPAAFDEEFDQLKPYYACAVLLPPSSPRIRVFGYYLMRLLEKNRIADFHAELKLLSDTNRADPFIRYAVKVEKLLSRCPTLDCKLLREIYRIGICGQRMRKSYIPPLVQRVMFSRPSKKTLPICVEEEVEEEVLHDGLQKKSKRSSSPPPVKEEDMWEKMRMAFDVAYLKTYGKPLLEEEK